jgi:hypothetical protein
MNLEELAATILAETFPIKDIEVNDLRGVELCSDASKKAGETVKLSLEAANRNVNRHLSEA